MIGVRPLRPGPAEQWAVTVRPWSAINEDRSDLRQLREGSFNTALLGAAKEPAPEEMVIEVEAIADFPPDNADVQKDGFPEPVRRLAERIRQADAVLISTPEYNYSIPGVLKNAID